MKLLNELSTFCKSIQDSNPNEKYIRYLMTQKDIRGRTVFQIAAENSFFHILETPEIGVIVKKMWNGRFTHDGIFASCSLYKYLDESTNRLNNPFEKFEEMDMSKCYFYQLFLWTESCSMRYWPESISTILLIILYNILLYFLVNEGHVMTKFNDLDLYLKNLIRLYIIWNVCINLNMINQYIFCKFAKRKYYMNIWGFIEVLMMIFSFLLFLDTNEILGNTNESGMLIKSNEMSDLAFISRALILAFNDIFVWLRVTGILLTFKDLGPLIRMISLLSLQTAKYLIVYALYITGFAGIFTAIFYRDSEQFSSFSLSFTTLFGGFINNLNAFDFLDYHVFGPIMLFIYVTLSGIMLINLLIASLSNVYKTLNLVVEASHRSVLISYYRRYKWDSNYGFMIFLTTPLNIINILVIPIFLVLSKKFSVEKLNNKICKVYYIIFYFPIMFLLSLILNIFLMPICYIKGIIEATTHEFYSRDSLPLKICSIFKWIAFGPIFIVMIYLRDHLNMVKNIFNKVEIPSSEKTRIKNLISNEDVILLLQFIHNRSKEDQNDLHTLFIDFLYFEQDKKAEEDNIIKEKSYYIKKINQVSKTSNKKNSSYYMMSKTRNFIPLNNKIKKVTDSTINGIENQKYDGSREEDSANNYVKRNIIIIEILENFLIDDGSDNYIVDIQKFKMLLPKSWHIDDRYIKRLVFTEITSLNRAVNNLKSKKNVILQYQLLNTISTSMINLDKNIDDIGEKTFDFKDIDDFEENQFYYDIIELLGKVSGDLKSYIDSTQNKFLTKKGSMRISLKERELSKDYKEINNTNTSYQTPKNTPDI